VPIALVALLLYTQPIWTVVLGRWLLAEMITPRKLGSAGLAIAGTVVLLDPIGLIGAEISKIGMLAALASGLFLSLWVILARISALRSNPALATTFGYSASTALVLLAVAPLAQAAIPDPALSRLEPAAWLVHWPAVALYTLIANVLPALLVIGGMRRVDASSAGVLLLLEPVSAALFAAWAFAEPLTANVLGGGALILGSNALLIWGGDPAS
jgi:drug/metabolite transporter (DMT)-like permease